MEKCLKAFIICFGLLAMASKAEVAVTPLSNSIKTAELINTSFKQQSIDSQSIRSQNK